MLRVEELTVEVDGKPVLRDINLEVPKGEVHVLFGPNGSGKSSLIMSILGFPAYRVVSGRILFKGQDITSLPINERVKLGLGVAFQNPPTIRGVKLREVLERLVSQGGRYSSLRELAETLNFPLDFMERDLNLGFSGGEMKKSEVIQILAQNPDFVILDEPDSGVDVENLQLIGKVIKKMIEGKSALLITHLGYILHYVDADEAHVILDGTIVCSGRPLKILTQILNEGYAWCRKCPKVRRERCER
ncbi:ABC transporter ATP-binding protein [Candidatus Bathyarchaeota archaeon B24-2]|nr:MAG: ABC transporter ATP-binding protein [Candidatus Bathyarchaeota archaeon B24-2]